MDNEIAAFSSELIAPSFLLLHTKDKSITEWRKTMLRKLDATNLSAPFKGFFDIKRVYPGKIYKTDTRDKGFGPTRKYRSRFNEKGINKSVAFNFKSNCEAGTIIKYLFF